MEAQCDLVLTERVGHVLVATMNRPQARNALNPELINELSAVLRGADADPEIRAIVLTGAGPAFCAGLDLKAFTRGGKFDGLVYPPGQVNEFQELVVLAPVIGFALIFNVMPTLLPITYGGEFFL